MYFCPTCLDMMKPLFTGFFCPNDCDRPQNKKVAQLDPYSALVAISKKVLSQDREYFIQRGRGMAGVWYAFRYRGTWRVRPKYTMDEAYQSEIIIKYDGRLEVMKNRFGPPTMEGIPDQP